MPNSIDALLQELDSSVAGFSSSLDSIQSDVLAEVELLIKELNISGGNLVQDVANLQKLNKIKAALNQVVVPKEYTAQVIEFGKAFNTVEKIQSSYFDALVADYTAPVVLGEVKNLAITETVGALTQQGLDVAITNKIGLLIQNSINSGDKYTSLTKQLSTFIKGNSETPGAYQKHVKQITTDSINTYAASYNKIVSDDLGLEWFMWVGALVNDSRELCVELVAKKYIHKSEIPDILNGYINGKRIPIYVKTGLPSGMIPGTNKDNFQTRRGGYQCNHLPMPVLESRVPIEIRNRIKK